MFAKKISKKDKIYNFEKPLTMPFPIGKKIGNI